MCANLKLIKTFMLSDKLITVIISEKNEFVAYASEFEIFLIKESNGEKFHFYINDTKPIQLCFDPFCKFLVCACSNGAILMYSIDSMCFIKRLEFSNNISFLKLEDCELMKRREVVSWHGDGNFFSILNRSQILYCEKCTWRVNYRFEKYSLRKEEFYSALSYSNNKKNIFVFTNFNKIISYFIVNSEVVFILDLITHSNCYSSTILDKTLIVSNSVGNLIGLDFNIMNSIDELDTTACFPQFDKIDIEETHVDNKSGIQSEQFDFSVFKYKKTKFSFK
jgi:hypothetical protein